MMFNFWKRSIVKAGIFQGNYIDARAFFALVFREVPCIAFVGDLDVSAALKLLRSQFASDIVHIYQSNYFDHDDKKLSFATTIVVLASKRMIVFGFDYMELLHASNDYEWCAEMAQVFAAYRKSAPVHTPVIGFSVS